MNIIYTLLHLWLSMSFTTTSMITEYPKCLGTTYNQITRDPGAIGLNIAVDASCTYRILDMRGNWRTYSTGGWSLFGSLTQTPAPGTEIHVTPGVCINDSVEVVITGLFKNDNGTPANPLDDQYCEINVIDTFKLEDRHAPEISPMNIVTPFESFTAEYLKRFFTSAYLSDNCTPLYILQNNLELIPDASRPIAPIPVCRTSISIRNVYHTRIRTRDACGNYSPYVNLRVQFIDTIEPRVSARADTNIFINSFCQARITPDLYRGLTDDLTASADIRTSHRILSPGPLHGNIPAGGTLVDRSYICSDADRRIKVRVCAQDCFGNGNLYLASDEIGTNCAVAIVNLRDATPAVCPCIDCADDYETLKALYRSTDGAHWTHTWDTSDCTLDGWYGVYKDFDGRVKRLELPNNNLNGTIPVEIGNLTHLKSLYLQKNLLRDTIPGSIGSLILLHDLFLDDNQLTGSIPSEINHLSFLERLHVEHNQLTQSNLIQLGDLLNLDELDLSYNLFHEPIAREVGNLSELRLLNLDHNQFNGPVPNRIGYLSNLEFLHLNDNQLSGCFHIDLHRLCDLSLIYDFANNPDLPGGGDFEAFCEDHITGACCSPDWETLKAFYRATNGGEWTNRWDTSDCTLYHWYGVKTDQDGRVTSLELLRNNLNGSLPAVIGNLSRLKDLELALNNLTGPIPPEIGDLSQLEILDLRKAHLNGSIPHEIGNLLQLRQLILSNNDLSGAIPSEIGMLIHLEYLNLSGNHFSPLTTDNSGLRSNQFNSSIPEEIGNLVELRFLDLSHNQLTGSIPGQLGKLPNIDYINLGYNHLSGCLSKDLHTLCTRFIRIDISNNPDLPFHGDFDKFCIDGAGECDETESCTAICHGPLTVNASLECDYVIDGTEFDLIYTDCAITSLTYELRGATIGTGMNTLDGVHLNMGITDILWTVNGGNFCFNRITVADTISPIIICPPSQTIYIDGFESINLCTYILDSTFDSYSADACNLITSYDYQFIHGDELFRTRGTLNGVRLNTGTYTITGTSMDAAGNEAHCNFEITIIDTNLAVSWIGVIACESYTWRGVTYIHSGTYDDTILAPWGCNAITRLILTITPPLTWYRDVDGDGYADDIKMACDSPGPGYITASVTTGDCNDNDPGIHPGAADNNCNGKDDDCDGKIDEDYIPKNCTTCINGKEITTLTTYYQDLDGDGFGNPQVFKQSCEAPPGYIINNTDCNDGDKTIHPGAADNNCNGKDDDCDGKIDEDYIAKNCTICTNGKEVTTLIKYYQDADGDTYGNPQIIKESCEPTAGYVKNNTDCNDGDKSIHPGVPDNNCNGKDDDCDGKIDEDYIAKNCTTCINGKETTTLITFYQDFDGDGYGNPQITKQSCEDVPGYVKNNSDCNDGDKNINPGVLDNNCNGKDDNCNGKIDEGYIAKNCTTCVNGKEIITLTTWYIDFDKDGYGNPGVSVLSCEMPAGYVKINTDCNDKDSKINPDATELCNNGVDENCNGKTDECSPFLPVDPESSVEKNFAPLGLQQVQKIDLYPNPNNGDFTIRIQEFDFKTTASIVIYSSLGHKIFEKSILNSNTSDISLGKNQIPNGLYILVLKNGRSIAEKKFIVQQ